MKHISLLVGIVVIFLAGVISGAAGMRLFIRWSTERVFFVGGPEAINRAATNWLGRELDLDPDQKVKAERIVVETQQRIRGLRLQVQPELRKIFDEELEKLKPVLTEEQRKKMELLHKKAQERWHIPEQP